MTDLAKLADVELERLSDAEIAAIEAEARAWADEDRKLNQLLSYRPVSAAGLAVHKSTARTIALFAGNRCLPLTAPVLMGDGSWRPLGAITVGDMVMAADPDTGRCEPTPVVATHRSGAKDVFRVTFSDGGWFVASADHMLPLYLGSGRWTTDGSGVKRPKALTKRRLGDYLFAIGKRGTAKRISAVSPTDIRTSAATSLPLPPYLLGAWLGDGSSPQSGVKFHNVDEAVLDRVRVDLRALGMVLSHHGGPDWGIVNAENEHRVTLNPNRMIAALRALGLHRTNSYTKFIPPAVFALDREDRKKVLAGLIDTDGEVSAYSSCSDALAGGFVRLVRSLGGKATASRRRTMAQNGAAVDSWRVYWRLNERLPLALPRKQPRNSPREVDYRRRVCRSAEPIGRRECGDITVGHPAHCYVTGDYVIVSNSGKTDTMFAEAAMLSTGVWPAELAEIQRPKFKGPIKIRVDLQSLTTTLHSAILPKLQYWAWNGLKPQGGEAGHWGWVPRNCLVRGEWDKSWQEKLRELRVICRDPDTGKEMGESVWQFVSHDMDSQDLASGEFDLVIHDEPPPYAHWRENQARVLSVGGRLMLGMTFRDDASIPLTWIIDEVWEPGQAGPGKAPEIECIELDTLENPNIDQAAVRAQADRWDETTRAVRIKGKPLHLSNRVHPLFTDRDAIWSFAAGKVVPPLWQAGKLVCPETGSDDLEAFSHVAEFEHSPNWPVIWLIDPHPRKPHMMMMAQVRPDDDIDVVATLESSGTPAEVRDATFQLEQQLRLNIVRRVGDPNMLASPASAERDTTWLEAFARAQLNIDLADDGDVGRAKLNEYLRPDPRTRRPRIRWHVRCAPAIGQMKRFVWGEYKRGDERDVKQVPKDKHDDYPALCRYLMNLGPEFAGLTGQMPVITMGHRRKGYG